MGIDRLPSEHEEVTYEDPAHHRAASGPDADAADRRRRLRTVVDGRRQLTPWPGRRLTPYPRPGFIVAGMGRVRIAIAGLSVLLIGLVAAVAVLAGGHHGSYASEVTDRLSHPGPA